jgi:CCR4-NOT transcription complex subunit 2
MASSEYLAILSAAAAASKSQPSKSTTTTSTGKPQSSSSTKLDLSNFDSEFPALSSGAAAAAAASKQANNSHVLPSGSCSVDNYGLEGLVHVVRSTASGSTTANVNPQIMLNLGTDLLSLGLDLNSSDFLYTKFTSPWLDGKSSIETMLPACYYSGTANVPLVPDGKILAQVADETLFFVFYAMPRDKAQLAAASQLWTRGWRYHKALKMWFCLGEGAGAKAASSKIQALFSGKPLTQQHQQQQHHEEMATFVFFDLTTWQRV